MQCTHTRTSEQVPAQLPPPARESWTPIELAANVKLLRVCEALLVALRAVEEYDADHPDTCECRFCVDDLATVVEDIAGLRWMLKQGYGSLSCLLVPSASPSVFGDGADEAMVVH